MLNKQYDPTLIIPELISARAARLSQSGYSTTAIAEQNAQIIPITTHAVKPPTPYTVCAKNRGRGMMISMINVYKHMPPRTSVQVSLRES